MYLVEYYEVARLDSDRGRAVGGSELSFAAEHNDTLLEVCPVEVQAAKASLVWELQNI